MSSLAVRDPAMDRSLRSVFVGNIPYEATEEQLKDIFSEVGSVVSFRLVYDRETGKPKGYGFCEYQDQETALSAMRNLNGREFSGRALRVDNAASEKNKEELKSLGPAAPIIDSPYGDPIDPEDAPESITRAVASLPPEQMFELMKQMKLCVQNSHQEARNMLLQNPQLAYALLQAQVVMRIMDPEIALKILHRKIHVTPLIPGKSQPVSGPVAGPVPGPVAGPVSGPGPGPGLCPGPNVLLNQQNPPAPQPQHLARRPVKDIPPLMQTPIQGGIPAPGPMPAAVPGPGSLTPGGALQPQVGMPVVGPVPLERGQMQMSDPRAPMPRGPMTAGGLPPRGLLGDAPNDPRGGTLLSVTHTEVEPRGYLGPPHQGPPMHHAPGHDSRGPSSHEMRGGPITDPRMLIGEPRGPMIDQRGLPLDGRGSRDSRGMETRAMETEVLEARVMERRGMETCAMEARGMEGRGMDGRGMEIRGPGPSSRGPMTSGIQGPGPINMGAGGPQGPRQVPSISGVGNPGAGMQGAGMQGAGMQGPGMQGAGMQGPGMQGAGMQGPGMQGGGMQGASMQGGGMQGASMQGGGMQGAGLQGAGMQGTGIQGAGKQSGGQPSSFSPGQSQVTPQDQEKAALIMQVLQLTADQIAMLPPEQRQSILILKEQIQKSTGAS